jgi:hypothetical protein
MALLVPAILHTFGSCLKFKMVPNTRLLVGIFFWSHVFGISVSTTTLAGQVEKRQTPKQTPEQMPPFYEMGLTIPEDFRVPPALEQLTKAQDNHNLSRYFGEEYASKKSLECHSPAHSPKKIS